MPLGVWSGVVAGAEAAPELQEAEQSRLSRAGLQMLSSSPPTHTAPTADTTPTVDTAKETRTKEMPTNVIPKPRPKQSLPSGKHGSKRPNKVRQSCTGLMAQGRSGAARPVQPVDSGSIPVLEREAKNEDPEDDGWSLVGAPHRATHSALPVPKKSPKSSSKKTRQPPMAAPPKDTPQQHVPPVSAVQQQPVAQMQFAAFGQMDLDSSDKEDFEDSADEDLKLIDRPARQAAAARRAPKKAKGGKAATAKRLANQKGRHVRNSRITPELVWWEKLLGGKVEQAHLITLCWVLSPPVIIFLLYLFIFVL